jgi:hypothetical protein
MGDFERTSWPEAFPSGFESSNTSGRSGADGVEDGAGASLLPPASLPGWPVSATMAEATYPRRVRRSLSNMRRRLIVAVALVGSVTGLFVGLGSSSASAAQPVAGGNSTGHLGSAGKGSNA